MFFESASTGKTNSRPRSEVYIAQALLARPRIFSSWEIRRSLAKHGLMEVRPRCSDFATRKANTGGTVSVVVLDHRELLVDESMSIIRHSIAPCSEFEWRA